MNVPRSRIVSVLLAAALAVSITGCGSSGENATASTTKKSTAPSTADASDDASGFDCKAADSDAVEAVLGTLPAPEERNAQGISTCLWPAQVRNLAAVSVATVGMFSRDFDPAKERGTPVDGIGDEAYIAPGAVYGEIYSATGTTLWVRKGSEVYAISVDSTVTPDPTEAQLRAIAAPFVS